MRAKKRAGVAAGPKDSPLYNNQNFIETRAPMVRGAL